MNRNIQSSMWTVFDSIHLNPLGPKVVSDKIVIIKE